MSQPDLALLRDGIAKARPWFSGLAGRMAPDVAAALADVDGALGRLEAVVSESLAAAGLAHDTTDPEVARVRTACEVKIAEVEAAKRDEQTSQRFRFRSLQSAFIRTRRRKLKRRYRFEPTESVTFDVVHSERVDGKVAQRFVLGLGTFKRGSSGDDERRARFLELALRDLLRAGFRPELEHKLLVELAAKAEIRPEHVARCRVWLQDIHQHRGWSIDDLLERFDKLEAAAPHLRHATEADKP